MGYSAWRIPDSGYAIRCCGLGDCYDGSTGWPAGAFLAEYDPEAHDGHGEMWWTEDVCRAVSFPDIAGAIECYQAIPANRPVREDGKPNRPLTIFTVEYAELPDPAPFRVNPARVRRVSAVTLRDELRAAGLMADAAPAPLRQVESEEDFLKRLHQLVVDGDARKACKAAEDSPTVSLADEMRKMGLT
jgi:hypothetical protein